MRLTKLIIIDTWEGHRAAGFGRCTVCDHTAWDFYDVGLVKEADGYSFDEHPTCACPRCGCEMAISLDGDEGPAGDDGLLIGT